MTSVEEQCLEELKTQLPLNASHNQSGVPQGQYRTSSGRFANLKSSLKKLHVIDPNNFAPMGKTSRFYPVADEMVVRVDQFKDEAMCRSCSGEGHSQSTCNECGGNKVIYVDANGNRDKRSTSDRSTLKQLPCPQCLASSYSMPFQRSTGYSPCIDCHGTGQRVGASKITIAEQYESVPTTGIVMAHGPEVIRFQRGDRVLFDTFTGKEYKYEGRTYRIIKQQYPMGKIVGQDDIRIQDAAQHLMK